MFLLHRHVTVCSSEPRLHKVIIVINCSFLMNSRLIWRRLRAGPLISSRPPTRLENCLRFLSTRIANENLASLGSYSVILPEEPFVWGVSHISPRTVPSSIGRPSYARTLAEDKDGLHSARSEHPREPHKDDSRIRLGSEEETKLRASSKLARRVREFSGTLVRVGIVLIFFFDGRHDDPILIARDNHKFDRRSDSRLYRRSRCLPIPFTLFGVPSVMLYQHQQRSRARNTRRVCRIYHTLM